MQNDNKKSSRFIDKSKNLDADIVKENLRVIEGKADESEKSTTEGIYNEIKHNYNSELANTIKVSFSF